MQQQAVKPKPTTSSNVVKKPIESAKPNTVKAKDKTVRSHLSGEVRKPTLTSRLSILNLSGSRERREAVAAQARAEASS
jgi:hypothetical protein